MTSCVNLIDALVRILDEALISEDRVAWTLDVAALALEHGRRDHARASFEGHERHFRVRRSSRAPGGAVLLGRRNGFAGHLMVSRPSAFASTRELSPA